MKTKLKSAKNISCSNDFDFGIQKKNTSYLGGEILNFQAELSNILLKIKEQSNIVIQLLELQKNIHQLLDQIAFDLHSIIGRGENKKTLKRISKEERVAILKNKPLFGGRTYHKRKSKNNTNK